MSRRAADPLAFDSAYKVFHLDGQERDLTNKTPAVYADPLSRFATFAQRHGVTALGEVAPVLLKGCLIHLQQKGWHR